MKIHRSRPGGHFTQIPDETLRDGRLSYAARGVLAEILSRPDDWTTNADDIWPRAHRERGSRGEGRDTLHGVFAELEAAGYLDRVRTLRSLPPYPTARNRSAGTWLPSTGAAHGTLSASSTCTDSSPRSRPRITSSASCAPRRRRSTTTSAVTWPRWCSEAPMAPPREKRNGPHHHSTGRLQPPQTTTASISGAAVTPRGPGR